MIWKETGDMNMIERDKNNSLTSTVCSMNDFFKAYAQAVLLGVGVLFVLLVFSLITMLSIPPYLTWAAEHSIAKNEAKGAAIMALSAKEGQALVDKANMQAVAMNIISQGHSTAASSKAESIKILGDSARRYPKFASDEYLVSLSSAISSGDIQEVIYVPTEKAVPVVE